MFAQRPLPLPTVSTKNDAQANQNDTSGSKLPVADSLVLLQSLKQSRTHWLTKAFLRFSTRSKEKVDQIHPAPPPHSLSLAGTCDVEIGPHLFPQTKIFFVQYRYGPPPAAAAPSTPAPAPAPVSAPAPAPTTHTAPITVSHELHAKVLAAAAKDPELHHVLQLASQGRANVTQLRTLGTAIKAIEAGTYPGVTPPSAPAPASHAPAPVHHAPTPSGQAQSAPAPQPRPVPSASSASVSASTPVAASTSAPTPTLAPATTPAPTPSPAPAPAPTPAPALASAPTHKPTPAPVPPRPHPHVHPTPAIPTTAVLLEFTERPIDRWLLPTEYVLIDRRPNDDVLLSTFYPFDAYVPSGGAIRSKPAHPLTMRFAAASSGIWDALLRTCTTVIPSSVQSILGEVITNVPPRTYLQYRIAPGAMWEDLKAANPTAQAFLLPSTTPTPTTTIRPRRADGTTGNPAKKRKTDAGDSTGASTPREPSKSKGKGKEKETAPADASVKPLVSVPQTPNAVPATSNAPVAQNQAPVQHANTSATPTPTPPVTATHPTPLNAPNPARASAPAIGPTPYPPVATTTTGTSSVYSASGAPTLYAAHVSVAPTTSNPTGPLHPAMASTNQAQSHPAQTPTPAPTQQSGTLNQVVPRQPPPSVARAPVQHVSFGQPGESTKDPIADMGANPSSLEK